MGRYVSLRNRVQSVGLTDTGKVREHNEDSISLDGDIGLFVLADGMGGYNAGEVASGIAVKTIIDLVTEACKREKRGDIESGTGYMRQTIVLRDAIHRANKVINQTAQSQPQCEGMGTTLVASLFYDNRVSIAHVGDSRAYLYRDGELTRITQDHTPVGRLVAEGRISQDDADRHPQDEVLGGHDPSGYVSERLFAAARWRAIAASHNCRMRDAATFAVTEITPSPPCNMNSQHVASSPLSSLKPGPHASLSTRMRFSSPVASLMAWMLGCNASLMTVSGFKSTPVRLGTLYRISGRLTASAIAEKWRRMPSCGGLL